MSAPAINFPNSGHITAEATYWIKVPKGRPCMISVKAAPTGSWSTSTMNLYTWNRARDREELVAGASFTADFERRFIPDSDLFGILLGGGGTPDLWVKVTPIG